MDRNELVQKVGTIVVVLLENRSFDHVLGHLSLDQCGGADIDGMKQLDDPNWGNPSANGTICFPFLADDRELPNDLPHERPAVARQLAHSAVAGGYTMTGFVRAYEDSSGTSGVLQPPPLAILKPEAVPMTSFLAREYAACDRWFAPLPTSTQPNRLMAMSGYTVHDTTQSGLLPNQNLVFDWLTAHHVRWRVYSAGLSFFTLMPKMWPLLLTDHFRSLSQLSFDAQHEPDASFPQVIFVEPDYDDSPVHLSGHASDNHPPVPMAFGEAFLRQTYEALTKNAARWKRTVMIVTYDEHGGFFDHVSPLPVPFEPPAGAAFAQGFTSTGVRVPGIVVSPLVRRGQSKSAHLDHTSILQLIAERFGAAGESYSASVAARKAHGIESVSHVLDSGLLRADIPKAPSAPFSGTAAVRTNREAKTDNQKAFAAAIVGFKDAHGTDAMQKYPAIAHYDPG